MAKCVVHDDSTPSLHIHEKPDGQVLICCHAGCEQTSLINELRVRGLWANGHDVSVAPLLMRTSPSELPIEHAQLGPYSQHWDYLTARGDHVLRICRWDTDRGKEIRPLSRQEDGWAWKQLEAGRPLYRLPELLSDKRRVLLVEGERTADAAANLLPQFIATTWSGGAKAIAKTDWRDLSGRDVTLLADHDSAGATAMDKVAEVLKTKHCTIRRLDPKCIASDLPDGWDLADIHPDQDFDIEHLRALIEQAPITTSRAHALSLRQAADIVSNPIPAAWLLRPYLEELVLALIFGELGTLKSFVTLDMLLAIASGSAWGGSPFRCKPRPVVYVSAEGKGLSKRLQAWAIHHRQDLRKLPFYAIEHALDLSNVACIESLTEAIEALEIQPAIIGIDTLSRNCGPLDENAAKDMGAFINALDTHLRQRLKCSVLLVHHVGHQAKDRARGSYALMASTDAWFKVERPDPEGLTIKFTTGRLKDSESPPAIYLQAHVVNLGTFDDDHQPEASLVLLPTDDRPTEARKPPSGKQQTVLLRLLESEHRSGNTIWPIGEIRKLARERLNMAKTTAQSVVLGLCNTGFLKQTVGGLALADPPPAEKSADHV